MKILIVGGGGREHALAWRLAQSPIVTGLVASPGNPGIAQLARCLPAPQDVSGYCELAESNEIDLTLVGPEAPLVAGIVDRFHHRGLKIIGPTRAAAQLEGSKIFAKHFFDRAGIPTARSVEVISVADGIAALNQFPLPVVIKADGLAAGKGVTIANTNAEARSAVEQLGPRLVIEEFLEGEEVSFIGLCSKDTIHPLPATQDHKRVFNGDGGPNTGGMGAYLDSRIVTSAQTSNILEQVMLPAISQMSKEGIPFTGFLFAGLMMTPLGPKILEFNVRLGDPETQVLMHSFPADFAEWLLSGNVQAQEPVSPSVCKPSVCVVLAAAGYPELPSLGDEIIGIEAAEAAGTTVFQAGTRQQGDKLVTSGGRVLGITASGTTLRAAIDRAYEGVEKMRFNGMHFRSDIGHKGLRRW